MINPTELKNTLVSLFPREDSEKILNGHGILTDSPIFFDEEKIRSSSKYIASVLEELGIDGEQVINLSRLAKTKDGKTWNELKTFEDFQALELLLASSDACHFIVNDEQALQYNLTNLDPRNVILISSFAKYIAPFEKWIRLFKADIIDKMSFITNPEAIKTSAEEPEEVLSLHLKD